MDPGSSSEEMQKQGRKKEQCPLCDAAKPAASTTATLLLRDRAEPVSTLDNRYKRSNAETWHAPLKWSESGHSRLRLWSAAVSVIFQPWAASFRFSFSVLMSPVPSVMKLA